MSRQVFLSILLALILLAVLIWQPGLKTEKSWSLSEKPIFSQNNPLSSLSQGNIIIPKENISIFFPFSADMASPSLSPTPSSNLENLETNSQFYPLRNWNVSFFEVASKAAVAADFFSDKIFYQKNINEPLPIASLTKLMTTLIVLENYNLDDIIKVSKTAVQTESEKGGLVVDEELTVKSLLKIMLIESSNDAAVALAEKIGVQKFVELMNEKARELNMKQTIFFDPAGLNGKNVSSINDLIKLTKYLFSTWPEFLEITRILTEQVYSVDGKIIHQLKNTNQLLEKMPEILGGKTGYSDEANGCLLTLIKIGEKNKIITIILGSLGRFGETERLIKWLKEAYIWK